MVELINYLIPAGDWAPGQGSKVAEPNGRDRVAIFRKPGFPELIWRIMQNPDGYFSLFGIAVTLIILWTFALVWIWQDADETYGNGWFWALMMVIFPGFTFIVYLVVKRITHRTVNEDLQAWENRQSRHGWGWSNQHEGQIEDLTQPTGRVGKFKPFNPGFSASVEKYVERKSSRSTRNDDWLS